LVPIDLEFSQASSRKGTSYASFSLARRTVLAFFGESGPDSPGEEKPFGAVVANEQSAEVFAGRLAAAGTQPARDPAVVSPYWSLGLLAREQHDRSTERPRLAPTLDIINQTKHAPQYHGVRAELKKAIGPD
jgi:hypothetical protein